MTFATVRQPVCAFVLLLTAVSAAGAQRAEHPATITPEGGASVARVSEARRTDLFGVLELYSVALYAENATIDRGSLASPDTAKALRVAVAYKEDLNPRVTFDWRRELVPRLESGAAAHLYGAVASLRQGDILLIEYAPGKGTTVRVNRTVVVADANHDLMLQFLDHWIGQRPVSEEIKRALTGSSSSW